MKSGSGGEQMREYSRIPEQSESPVVKAWEEHGTPGAERAAEDLKRFGTITERARRTIDALPSRQEYQDRALAFFESEGIIRRGKAGMMIFDRETFRQKPLGHALRAKVGNKMRIFFERGVTQAVVDALSGVDAVAEGATRRATQPKPILYAPKTAEEAFDPEMIRRADFQVGLWETPLKLSDARIPGTEVSQLEVAVAAVIYHPKYGNGRRDASGRLMVTDPETEKEMPISGEWLHKMGLQREAGEESRITSPQEFLQTGGKRLVEFGLLKPEDFLRQSVGNITESVAAERYRVGKTGEVMMNGVLYYLGKYFVGKRLRIFEFAPGKGGVAFVDEKGGERLAFTFRMFDREDPKLKRVKFGSGKLMPRAGAADVELTEARQGVESSMLSKKKGSAGIEKAFTDDLWNNARVKLAEISEASQKSVQDLFGAIPANKRKEAYAFGRTFGAKGLERLADMETIAHGALHVVRLANELGPLLMRDVFKAYDAIVTEAEQVEQAIERVAGGATARELDRQRVKSELLSRAQKLLAETETSSKKPQATASELLKKLEGYRSDLVLLASVFKTAFKGKEGRAAFDEMKGVTLESRTADELSAEDRMGMRAISFMNWKEIPSMAEYIQKSLEEKITHGGGANRFYMLKKDGDAVAFMRFEDRPDGSRYCGSLNVAPSMRGSGLGEAFFKEALDVEGRDHRLVANVHPKTLAGTAYVERNGFKITGTEQAPTGDPKKTEWGFTIEREPQNDDAPESGSRMTTEYMMSLAQSGDLGPGGSVAKRYDVRRETSRMKEEATELARRGFVGTRYFADPRDAETRYILFTPMGKVEMEKRARSIRS